MKKVLSTLLLLMTALTGCTASDPLYTDVVNTIQVEDAGTGLVTIEYEHQMIHEGRHFFVAGFETEASGANVTFAVTTPDSATHTHMTFYTEGTSRTEMLVYEGATVTGGAAATPINNNRNSTRTSTLTIVKDPTVTVTGTMIFAQSSGLEGATPNAGKDDGLLSRDREIILKRNTTYAFVIISRDDDNTISYIGQWYEIDY